MPPEYPVAGCRASLCIYGTGAKLRSHTFAMAASPHIMHTNKVLQILHAFMGSNCKGASWLICDKSPPPQKGQRMLPELPGAARRAWPGQRSSGERRGKP